MTRDHLGEQVPGPIIELAAKVKAALEAAETTTLVKTNYDNFYVRSIELAYSAGGDTETCGYLVPDEGDGSTFDFYTHRPTPPEA